MSRVIVTDYTFPDLAQEQAAAGGAEFVAYQCKTAEDVALAVAGADVAVVQFAPFGPAAAAAVKPGATVIRYGVGYNNIDLAACKARGMAKGPTTDDGLWTLTEVECMGNCASAPMVQINDDNFEDLTAERITVVLDALAKGESPKTGTQEPGRHTVEPAGALSSLTAMASENHDYRGEW